MKASEVSKYLDRQGLLNCEGGKIAVPIYCVDAQTAFGRVDVLVKVHGGQGEVWVSEQRVAWEA